MFWKRRKKSRSRVFSLRSRPSLEHLEDRLAPATLIEGFEDPATFASWTTVLRNLPAADTRFAAEAAHDGSLGLLKTDGYEWLIRNDAAAQFGQGQTLSAWIQFAGAADGRAYLAFGATPNERVGHLRTGGALSLVLAANTNQFLFQANADTVGSTTNNNAFTHTVLGTPVSRTYLADHWYKVTVTWAAGGGLTGRLLDSDGTTLLSTVTASSSTARLVQGVTSQVITAGGIGFRSFGSAKYIDSIEVDGTASTFSANVGRTLIPAQTLVRTARVDPLPFQYGNLNGSGLDVGLIDFSQLTQFNGGGALPGQIALAAANTSRTFGQLGVDHQQGWGPPAQGLSGTPGVVLETPLLQQFLLRRRPGESTTLVGFSDVKNFFSSSQGADLQHLRPGQQDTYGAGLNGDRTYYTPGEDVDPVTGQIPNKDYFGNVLGQDPRTVDGVVVYRPRTPAQHTVRLITVDVADIDPEQNPEGTEWYVMGNLWIVGDQNVANNSRWYRVQPSFNNVTGQWQFNAVGSQQPNFRTIPGLDDPVTAGPYVLGQTPSGLTLGPVSSARVTFSRPVDISTFTPDDVVSFTGPSGPVTVTAIVPVDPRNGTATVFDIQFTEQNADGAYTMVLGPDIRDALGNPMDQDTDGNAGEVPGDQYTLTFSLNTVGPDGFGYVARGTAFQDLDIVGQEGTLNLAIIQGTTDDGAGSIDLGSNRFNFYGTTYTGAFQLWVSTNGLVSFGTSGFVAFENNDLTNADGSTNPAIIAALWDDLNVGPGNPQIAFRFEGIGDADPFNDRLIIQWNRVRHFSVGSDPITFQIILQLNTGSNVGDIIFNYVDLDTGSPGSIDGRSATVGLKRQGTPGSNRLLVSFNGPHVFVGSGQAIRLSKDARFLDDGDDGFAVTPGWSTATGQGFQNDVRFAAPGTGSVAASWTFTNLVPGVYRVSATWSSDPNRAPNATFQLFNGDYFSSLAVINQQLAPDDFSDQDASWEDLGSPVIISTGTLVVVLTNAASGFVIADGIRILRIGDVPPVQIIDNGDIAFSTTGFSEAPGQGFQDDVHFSAPDSGFTADWTFAVEPGATYRIAITWSVDPNRASNAPFTILDGGVELTTVPVNQQVAPDDFDDAGVSWEILGEFTITSGVLVIRLSDLGADEFVIADAVRIERIA